MQENIEIQVVDLHKSFNDNKVLSGIDLSVYAVSGFKGLLL